MSNIIQQILENTESKTLEFKRDFSSPKPLLKSLVAFSNTAGGKLIIGVTDAKEIIGVKNPLDEEERLCNIIADSIAPRLIPNIELVTIENKTVLIVEVFLSSNRPHWIKSEGPEQGVYVRLGSTNRQADTQLIAELRRSTEGVMFDELPQPELSKDDIDISEIGQCFEEKRQFNDKTLLTMKLLTKYQNRLVPTNGALLLFGKDRLAHYPDAWIQCGRFDGVDKTTICDHIEINESLPRAVESILAFLKKHAMRAADLSKGLRRRDVWNIPLSILREVIINAVVHCDYSQRGAPIRVSFFDDRIEVENPGILLPGMTIEDMMDGVSKIRNPVIARVFRELGLIEQWGSGVKRIFSEAKEQGLKALIISEVGMRVRFKVPLKAPIVLKTGNKKNYNRVAELAQSRAQSRAQSGAQSGAILLALKSKPLSSSELSAVLNLDSKSGALMRSVKELLLQNQIEYTIPEKPGSRLQKYYLTTKGKKHLATLGKGALS